MKGRIVIVIVVLLLASYSGLFAEEGVNGKWWSRLNQERKEAFLIGHIHCLLDARVLRWDEDMYLDMHAVLAAVDAYFQGDPKRQSELLSPLMDGLIPQYMKHIKREPGGEYPCGPDAPYGATGGEFWATLYSPPFDDGVTDRAAYLTGYLECYRAHVKNGLHFSKPVSFYEAKLNEFYGVVDYPDSMSDFKQELACFPVAEALKKYADEVLEKQKR
ncbi:hypothetical protein EG19_09335 [Thermoanaerobaculum aquaticum]|uniref:Uncharacterized protein n=1 Tax=Thermoanaerobaculum aquaticum TaxID=1312852 RepID=A0A062XK10_9BACT|nr:hypothetical protein [Thermoanaerobaculum aquaticum]KDA52867.1 hypothetical protein EG19_09335 [Thermoanaerobaculum aquaticum]